MAMTEATLKERIKSGACPLYVLYGEEPYLVEQYTRLIVKHTVGEAADAFDLQQFDGQSLTLPQLEEAVEALPMLTEKKCVLVRDMDASAGDAEGLLRLIRNLPDSCVLVFRQMTVQPSSKKAWKTFLEEAEEVGTVAKLDRKSTTDAAKLLMAGAKRRGCAIDQRDAVYLVEQVGNDLNLLLRELDKLCALVGAGDITRETIDRAATKNLEAKVFDLSKAILRRDTPQALNLLHQFAIQREDPLPILGTLSAAYADLYRAKAAVTAGQPADSLAADFKTTYARKEWRLRNAARDGARLSTDTLRRSLEVLAQADNALKQTGVDGRGLLEQTVVKLIRLVQEG
ncbi:MAG: DNA polymerase III subunit delta [Clostridia bacterium]|nr:DNA polymerase III subunit delta [Clostridia bacterium]